MNVLRMKCSESALASQSITQQKRYILAQFLLALEQSTFRIIAMNYNLINICLRKINPDLLTANYIVSPLICLHSSASYCTISVFLLI